MSRFKEHLEALPIAPAGANRYPLRMPFNDMDLVWHGYGLRGQDQVVTLNKIYTKTGDGGTTALGSGVRVEKHHARIEAYGTVDETNAAIGMVRLHSAQEALMPLDDMLARIQNDLFDLGADLCMPETDQPGTDDQPGGAQALRISAGQVARLEEEIDELNRDLAPLRSFVLPGGCAAAATLHVARTVCRRAERATVALAQEAGEKVSPPALNYLNRLSDFLFVASRWANAKAANAKAGGDVLWEPGKTR